MLENLSDYNLKITKNEKNRKAERKSLVPFTKWYVKMYHEKYKLEKIMDAIYNNTIDELNKNLKSDANKIKNKIKNL